MKCLLICSYFDGKSTGSLRALSLAKYFNALGYDVTVYTTDHAASLLPGVKLEYIDHSLPFNDGSIFNRLYQIIRKTLYCLCGIEYHFSFRKLLSKNWNAYDVIWVSSPQPELLDFALKINEKIKAKIICDFRDGLLHEPLRKLNSLEVFRYKKLELSVASKANAITTVSKEISEYFLKKYNPNHVYTITNGFDFKPREKNRGIRDSLGSSDKVNIVYTGGISRSRSSLFNSLLTFVDAYDNLSCIEKDKLDVYFVGEYTPKEMDILRSRFTLVPKVTREESIQYQLDADYLLLFTGEDKSVLTGKFFEYLSAQRPIIAITSGGSINNIIHATKSGRCFNHDEFIVLNDYLLNLRKNTILNNDELISPYWRKNLNEKVVRIIEDEIN